MPDNDTPDGIWVSISELARRRNVSRSTIKERVDRLEAEGLVATRRRGKLRMVELAAFDHATGSVSDFGKELAAETTRGASLPISSEYREAQSRRAQYEAQLKALDLAERQRNILPIKGPHGVEAAATAIAAAIARDADGMMLYAEDLATAVSKEGVAGARRVLKEIGQRFRVNFAKSVSELAAAGREAERAGPMETDLLADDSMGIREATP